MKEETGLRRIQTDVKKKAEKGVMSVKQTPGAVVVFFIMCVCLHSTVFVFFFFYFWFLRLERMFKTTAEFWVEK